MYCYLSHIIQSFDCISSLGGCNMLTVCNLWHTSSSTKQDRSWCFIIQLRWKYRAGSPRERSGVPVKA